MSRLRIITCMILLLVVPTIGYPITPGLRRPSASALECMKEISQNYGHSHLAQRIQALKEDRIRRIGTSVALAAPPMTVALPVLMGNYADNAHIFTPSDFQALLFGANPTGSMTDYYNEVSYGQFQVTGTVYGPFTAAQSQSFYVSTNNGLGGLSYYPQNAGGFVRSVLSASDGSIDFSQFDSDGPDGIPNSGDDDGYVDALIVVFPDGSGDGGDADNIWSHLNILTGSTGSAYVTNDIGANGQPILINEYTIQGAEQGDGTRDVIRPIGVFCHEFGHALGLQDLYDHDLSSSGVGNWCLMGMGSWGARYDTATECTPVQMSASCKEYLGWVNPVVVTAQEVLTIPPVETAAAVYKMWEDGYQGGRYWLLENRTKRGFDKDLPGEGLLLWHVNENVLANNADSTRLVNLEEADGLNELDTAVSVELYFGHGNDGGDPYPGLSGNSTFDDSSHPSSRDVNDQPTGAFLTDIAYASGPGSDIHLIAHPRALYGYTLSYHDLNWVGGWGLNYLSTCYGAVRFTAPEQGTLVSARIGLQLDKSANYTVRIADDIVGSALQGVHSTTSGSLSAWPVSHYAEIPLTDSLPVQPNQSFVIDVSWRSNSYQVPITYKTGFVSGQSYTSLTGISYSPLTSEDVLIRAVIRYACIDSVDLDADGIMNACDNCPAVGNAGQADLDADGYGDVCDSCLVLAIPANRSMRTGDVNVNGTLTSADIIYLVNHVFKSGPAPLPVAESGDVNCSRTLTSADIIYLVNHVFKSGPVPCNRCSLL